MKRRSRPLGYRVKRVRSNASNFEGLAFSKGATRADEKRDRHAEEVAQIKRVREELFGRTNVCAVCGETEQQSACTHRYTVTGQYRHEMHEDPARSKTRGLQPEERFNRRICMRICPCCHNEYTANQVRCIPLTAAGFAGSYDVERKIDGVWTRVRSILR